MKISERKFPQKPPSVQQKEKQSKLLSLTPQSFHRAFVICQPGLEKQLVLEIQEVWPHLLGADAQPNLLPAPEIQIHEGGVELTSQLTLLLQLNFFLKLATRILLRLAEFRCRDLPKLFARVQSLDWNRILASPEFSIEVAASGSRFNNEKRVEATAREAIEGQLKKKSENLGPAQIFIRVFEDLVTISIDTSGDALYKRGWATFKGEAPLRETLAHFMLAQMLKSEGAESALGESVQLIDPMCGSGTLLLEAATYRKPAFERSFAFQQLLFCPKIFKTPAWKANYKKLPEPALFSNLRGLDVSPEALGIAQKNFAGLGIHCQWQVEDLFEKNPKISPAAMVRRWILCNPPYGMRLSQEGGLEKNISPDTGYLNRWLHMVIKKYSPKKIGFIYPRSLIPKNWEAPLGWKLQSRSSFRNGGTPVYFFVLSPIES